MLVARNSEDCVEIFYLFYHTFIFNYRERLVSLQGQRKKNESY